jgi:hypothetical protein
MSNVRAHRMSAAIAEYRLLGQGPEGTSFPVLVVLEKPEPSAEMSPAWSCAVTVSPLLSKATTIYGEGSFQTLCLSARFAVQALDTFVANGGSLKYETGESFEPDVFGFSLLPRAR